MFLALYVVNFGMIELSFNIEICLWNFTGYVYSQNELILEGQANEKNNLKNKGHPNMSIYSFTSDPTNKNKVHRY